MDDIPTRLHADRVVDADSTGVSGREVTASSVARRFRRLAEKWYRETRFTSSIHEIVMNKHYQQIIGLGPPAVPLILAEMKRRPHFWFWALRSITGANPVRKDMAGNLGRMTDAWLGWARRHGFNV
jgi:hypothetical protein